MSTYYKHSKDESVFVPYSFCCEHCLKESGILSATITGAEAVLNSNFKTLSEKNFMKLDKAAHENLVKEVKRTYKNANEKQIFSKAFNDECPHCHEPQSWAVSGIKNDMYSWPFAFVIVAVVLGGISYFYFEENKLMMTAIISGACLLTALGILIFNMIKLGNKVKKTSDSLQKNVPVIYWDKVQHLLDEA